MSAKNLVGLSLAIGNPEKSSSTTTELPVQTGIFLNLPVQQIDFFEKNPRRIHDEESYQQLKESIRASGIQQPVYVTQRPGKTRYVLARGGNTRLKIMKELQAESDDNKFDAIPCIYVEYTNDADLQIAHLIENEQRLEMVFWDKACAYTDMREIFQAEAGRKLSLRELEVVFAQHGLTISYVRLGLFFFSAENLHILGQACFGLSHSKAVELKKVHSSFSNLFDEAGRKAEFKAWWDASLQDWSHQPAADHLDAEAMNQHFTQLYQGEFGALPSKAEPSAATGKNLQAGSVQKREDKPRHPSLPVTPHGSPTDTPATPSGAELGVVNPPPITGHPTTGDATARLHQIAKTWLAMVNLDGCFKEDDAFALGYYLEYPDFSAIEKKTDTFFVIDNLHPEAGNVFTYLAKLSGQIMWFENVDDTKHNPILSLPEDSLLLKSYQDNETLDEINMFLLGDRSHLIDAAIRWQTDVSHPFCAIIDDLHQCLRQRKA